MLFMCSFFFAEKALGVLLCNIENKSCFLCVGVVQSYFARHFHFAEIEHSEVENIFQELF